MTDYYTCPECNGHRRYCGCKEKAKAKEMTDKQTPPDWVLIEAAKRSELHELTARAYLEDENTTFRALCDMIEKYEQQPPDRKLLCARTAVTSGDAHWTPEQMAIRAIELWEQGYGQ